MTRIPSSLCRAAVLTMVLFALGACTSASEPKKKPKPPPPPPPGSDLSTQPWARPEKDWEGGRPSFMPGSN
jgi:hypothetical protein